MPTIVQPFRPNDTPNSCCSRYAAATPMPTTSLYGHVLMMILYHVKKMCGTNEHMCKHPQQVNLTFAICAFYVTDINEPEGRKEKSTLKHFLERSRRYTATASIPVTKKPKVYQAPMQSNYNLGYTIGLHGINKLPLYI